MHFAQLEENDWENILAAGDSNTYTIPPKESITKHLQSENGMEIYLFCSFIG
jgi:hypothetical protein